MPTLTQYLQKAFAQHCPPDWQCLSEVAISSKNLNQLLGYSSYADLCLQRETPPQRIWIEFEISRADPVANHAKFATAHLFKPWTTQDTFISMISPHVTRGRRNLAANTISLMRQIGIQAFQTPLLPHLTREDIKYLNHQPLDAIPHINLNISKELNRAFVVSQPLIQTDTHRIHYVGNFTEVILNIHQWHQDIRQPALRERWGKRTITYFVYDPRTQRFAPSKFCAFLAIENTISGHQRLQQMTIDQYITYDESDPRFDGHVARKYLEQHLTMQRHTPNAESLIGQRFSKWKDTYQDVVNIHPKGPIFLIPPKWFA